MANTREELSRIHTRGLATPGKKYYRNDGAIFFGTPSKRLKIYEDADRTNFEPTDNVESDTAQEAIEEVGDGLSELTETVENNYTTTNTLIVNNLAEAKCFAITMATALG